MSSKLNIEHISQYIHADSKIVYEFASNPANLPQWAAGLSQGNITQSGRDWIADSPMGKVTIRFAETNSLGVMDHDVTLESGKTFHNPFRVIPRDEGCEVVFTLFRQPEMSDSDFASDRARIIEDLKKLKQIME